ncbi:MAG: ABC transporter ATP-binding protein [Bifidobacterium sp.]|jgi:peptide/nickel transport system ATP-binding protein|nr:ABC transporter ATP-binding protein [Bifidobacterium sp.]MCH4175380.1 ABC transporter ATP-binding protein [Bifidobacterium sp.]
MTSTLSHTNGQTVTARSVYTQPLSARNNSYALDNDESPNDSSGQPIVSVKNLNISFENAGVRKTVVDHISFYIHAGESVGIVGESGSGKSVTVRSLLGLYDSHELVDSEEFSLFGHNAQSNTEKDWRSIRGARIGFVLQDALESLDPLQTVGYQLGQARGKVRENSDSREQAIIKLLSDVGVPEPDLRSRQYPHELSGGLRQRALIASALAKSPKLLIADEPTTALDVTVQAQILDLLREKKQSGAALLLVSHDLAVVGSVCDRILVMKEGQIVEQGPSAEILANPREEYTKLLIAAVPSVQTRGYRLSSVERRRLPERNIVSQEVLIEAHDISKTYTGRHGSLISAVSHADFELKVGQTLGIVGESGSGKSTLARIAAALLEPDQGEVRLEGEQWSGVKESERRKRRHLVQVVSQDPLASFDPRYTVFKIVEEPLLSDTARVERHQRVSRALDLVRLPESVRGLSPRQLSGGQRQRVAIARAVVTQPHVLIADEAVSALDVSIQAQILDLFADIQSESNIGILFISHDLGVIHHISDSVIVMKDGRIVEKGTPEKVLIHPENEYTASLLAALPTLPESNKFSGLNNNKRI